MTSLFPGGYQIESRCWACNARRPTYDVDCHACIRLLALRAPWKLRGSVAAFAMGLMVGSPYDEIGREARALDSLM